MKAKRILLTALLLAAMCLNLFSMVSCGGAKTSAGDFIIPEEGFDTSKQITINFYHTMGSNLRDVLDRYIVEFNKLYPNITIEHEQPMHLALVSRGDIHRAVELLNEQKAILDGMAVDMEDIPPLEDLLDFIAGEYETEAVE